MQEETVGNISERGEFLVLDHKKRMLMLCKRLKESWDCKDNMEISCYTFSEQSFSLRGTGLATLKKQTRSNKCKGSSFISRFLDPSKNNLGMSVAKTGTFRGHTFDSAQKD